MTKPIPLPSLEYLQEIFLPDFENGDLIRLVRPQDHFETTGAWKRYNAMYAGRSISENAPHSSTVVIDGEKVQKRPALLVVIDGTKYLMHRVLFFMKHGWVPDKVDHKNGISMDNKHGNLVDGSTNNANERNRKKMRNKSGHTNITISAYKDGSPKYQVKVCTKHFGHFRTLEQAIEARQKAYDTLGGFGATHGQDRIHATVNKNREVEYHGAV